MERILVLGLRGLPYAFVLLVFARPMIDRESSAAIRGLCAAVILCFWAAWFFRDGLMRWYHRRRLREGLVITGWLAPDYRQDVLIVDLARLGEDVVGVKRRRYGVCLRAEPPPDFPEKTEYLKVDDLWGKYAPP
jgi:hypothetical protein